MKCNLRFKESEYGRGMFFGFIRLAKLTVSAQKPKAKEGSAPAATAHFCSCCLFHRCSSLLQRTKQKKTLHLWAMFSPNLATNQLPLRNSSNSSNGGGGIDRGTVGGRGKEKRENPHRPKRSLGAYVLKLPFSSYLLSFKTHCGGIFVERHYYYTKLCFPLLSWKNVFFLREGLKHSED